MLLDLLFQTTVSSVTEALNLKTQIGFVTVDVAVDMSHSRRASVTQSPIENGTVVSDHVTLEPARLTISGFVTDTPFFLTGFNLGAARSSATFHLLELMWESRQPFIVFTPRRLYTNMVIESLTVPESPESALRFQCELVEIKQVFSQNVTLPPTAETKASPGSVNTLNASNVTNPNHAAGVGGVRSTPTPAPSALQSWAIQGGIGLGIFDPLPAIVTPSGPS